MPLIEAREPLPEQAVSGPPAEAAALAGEDSKRLAEGEILQSWPSTSISASSEAGTISSRAALTWRSYSLRVTGSLVYRAT